MEVSLHQWSPHNAGERECLEYSSVGFLLGHQSEEGSRTWNWNLRLLLFLFSSSVMSDSLQPRDYNMWNFPVLHHLTEFAQTHVHWVSNAIQPSCPLLFPSPAFIFPSIRVFSNELVLHITWQKYSHGKSIGTSASALPLNIQRWFHLGLTGLISLHSKGLSRVFSNTTFQKHQFFGTQPSL